MNRVIRPSDVSPEVVDLVRKILNQGAEEEDLRRILRWSEWGQSTLDLVFEKAIAERK